MTWEPEVSIRWVIPSIDPAYRAQCVATLDPGIRARTLILDNTAINRGVAASWNEGARYAFDESADFLVICSESMRFGPTCAGRDFERAIERLDNADRFFATCNHQCEKNPDTGAGNCRDGYGWHLTAISTGALRAVGPFDERFWPAWWEDCDWDRRADRSGYPLFGITEWGIDAHLAATEHSLAAGLVDASWQTTQPIYEAKWNGRSGEEKWEKPAWECTWADLPQRDNRRTPT